MTTMKTLKFWKPASTGRQGRLSQRARLVCAVGAFSSALATPACSSSNSVSPDGGGNTPFDSGGSPDSTTGDDGGTSADAGSGADGGGAQDGGVDATDSSMADANSCPSGVVDSGSCLYDLTLQFSGTANGGSNPWSYGETTTPGGAFAPFTINGDAGAASVIAWEDMFFAGGQFVGWNGTDPNGAGDAPGSATNAANPGFIYPSLVKNIATTPGTYKNQGFTVVIGAGQVTATASSAHFVDVRFTAPATLQGVRIHAAFARLQTTNYSHTVVVRLNSTQLYSAVLSGVGASGEFLSTPENLSSGDTVDFIVEGVPSARGSTISVVAQVGEGLDAGATDSGASDGSADAASDATSE
jgi:hypothetical protein